MARKNATLNAKAFKKDLKKLERFVYGKFADDVLKNFKKETPVDSGYAKARTNKKVNKGKRGSIKILANYPYANVLDEGLFPNPPKAGTGKTRNGYSTQAPKGMSDPTLKQAKKDFDQFVRNL